MNAAHNKRAKASSASDALPGTQEVAGLLFSGWCREGYWSEGRLLKGKDLGNRPIVPTAPSALQDFRRPHRQARKRIEVGLQVARILEPYSIPVFMESHL